jgi:hypothetical protein
MRFRRLPLLLFAAALWLPVRLTGQLTPLSEAFPVWGPTVEQPTQSSPNFPVAAALRHGFAVASRSSTSHNDLAIDGRLVDRSGQPGPKILGVFWGNGAEPVPDEPSIAAAGSGGFVLVWAQWPLSVSFRQFGPGGVPLGDWQWVNETEDSYCSPSVAGNAAGGFAAAWESCPALGSSKSLFARAFSPAGTPATAERPIPLPGTADRSAMPRVGIDATGRFVVIWRQEGASAGDPARLCGRAFGARGGFLGSPHCIGDLAGETGGALALDPAGKFLAAWFGPAPAGQPAPLFVRRYQMDGTPLGGPVQVAAAADPIQLTASADGQGNAALAWQEGDRMRVLLVRRDGAVRGPAITISGVASHPASYTHGAALADSGRLLVTWRSGELIWGRLWQARWTGAR